MSEVNESLATYSVADIWVVLHHLEVRQNGRASSSTSDLLNYDLMTCHLTSVIVATTKKARDDKWWGCGEKGPIVHCWWEYKLAQPPQKTMWEFFKN